MTCARRLRRPIDQGWQAASAPPGTAPDPDQLTWIPARVPGTAAAATAAAQAPDRPLPDAGSQQDFDALDWWFRTTFDADPAAQGEQVRLHLEGVATVCEVWLNDQLLLSSHSMWQRHVIDISEILVGQDNKLVIRCLALAPLLGQARRPRARWRPSIAAGGLRWYRTTLLGRAPGFAGRCAPAGPWRPVWLERRSGVVVEYAQLRASFDGADGTVTVDAAIAAVGGEPPGFVVVEVDGHGQRHSVRAEVTQGKARTTIRLPGVAAWWPHSHGEPALYDARIKVGDDVLHAARLGFRTIGSPGLIEQDGLDLRVNDVRVFCRGAVWTPPDPVSLAPDEAALRQAITGARDAGMNMLRIPGTGCYESDQFFDLCDELGVLVWQDLMFANFDYPFGDPAFAATVTCEAAALLGDLAPHPCVTVICGNSEVEQQAAMLGLPAERSGEFEFYRRELPALIQAAKADAIFVPSAPCGGTFPFRNREGIASYFGVGGYRRGVEDARLAEVRFAAECLAFANVPDDDLARALGPVGGPRWKAGVPADVGASWDFDDVRDHYLGIMFGIDADELRHRDENQYLRLSALVTGEAMAAVFGQWRRGSARCGGGLILWLRDRVPGAGWGVIDSRGQPKAAWYFLRRALAPVAIWTTSDGLDGIGVHVANDRPAALAATLRIAVYADAERLIEESATAIEVDGRSVASWDAERLIGHFFDASHAYRFGPVSHDLLVATLEPADGHAKPGAGWQTQACCFPGGPPVAPQAPEQLGVSVSVTQADPLTATARVRTRRLLYGARITAAGFTPDDDYVTVAPGRERLLRLHAAAGPAELSRCVLSAANLDRPVAATVTGAG